MFFGHLFCSFDENFQSLIEEIDFLKKKQNNMVDQHLNHI